MSADLDVSTGRPAIALAASGGKAWHNRGELLQPGLTIEEWQKEAGLLYTVDPKLVYFKDDADNFIAYENRYALVRSDTKDPLSVVSDKYQLVQPSTVMEFFRDLTEFAGYEMETAGALNGGRKIWALAKTGKSFDVIKGDEHRGYVLLATSFDGGLATTAKFTDIRVVCQNTLTQALAGKGGVKVPHNSEFAADKVKAKMGLATEQFAEFVELQRALAGIQLKAAQVEGILAAALSPTTKREEYQRSEEQVKSSKAYKKIMALFEGEAKGSDIPGVRGTAYGLLNSATEYFDHHVFARTEESRLASAWFGTGEVGKQRLMKELVALV
jgi:phage/plasmid-like protein (TIGR03299 family)